MADSYDDFLTEQGGGGGTATDDSYAEFLRQQRQDKLAAERAASRTPQTPAPAAGAPSGFDLTRFGLTPLPAGAPAQTVTQPPSGLSVVGRTMIPPAQPDVTATPSADPSIPNLRTRLAIEQESPESFGAAADHPVATAFGALRGATAFGVDQMLALQHPVDVATGLAKAAVTAPYRALHGVGGMESSALERLGVPLPVDAQFGPSASEAAGGLFDTALLTEPAVGAAAKGLAMGRDAMYTAAAGEARFQSALERAQADAMAARNRKASASAPPPAGPLALPAGQYDLPAGEYSTREEPETDPSRLLTSRAVGAGVPSEGPAVTAPIGMPAVDWQTPLDETKRAAADASAARQQTLGLPRALLAPTVEESEGAARAAEVSGVNRELRATPEEVDTYRLTRDSGISPSMREIGRPTQLPNETDAAYATRVANRVNTRDRGIEQAAIAEDDRDPAQQEAAARAKGQYSSARTASGATRSIDMFPKMTDDALHAHMADLIDNQMGTQRGALNTAQAARLNAAEAELESRGHSTDDIWTTGLERGRDLNGAAENRKGFAAAGPLSMILGAGTGAAVGAAVAPPGKRGEGAAAGALTALGLITLGTSLARDGRVADEGANAARGAGRVATSPMAEVRNLGGVSQDMLDDVSRPSDRRAAPRTPSTLAEMDAAGPPTAEEIRAGRVKAGSSEPVTDADVAAARTRYEQRRRTGAIGDQPDEAGAGKTFPERLYSRSQRAIEAAPFKSGTGEQWSAVLAKNVGQDERAALTPFLEENRGKTLSKVDVLQEHARTRIKVGETTYRGSFSHDPEGAQIHLDETLEKHGVASEDTRAAIVEEMADPQAQPEDIIAKYKLPSDVRNPAAAEIRQALWDARGAVLRDEGATTRYGAYVEPGGTNYREHVLTLEGRDAMGAKELTRVQDALHSARADAVGTMERAGVSQVNRANAINAATMDQLPWEEVRDRYNLPEGKGIKEDLDIARRAHADAKSAGSEYERVYRSPHWPGVDNPLVHVRLSDRELPTGEKALHVEEMQSDWHQQGRAGGYGPEKTEMVQVQKSDLPKAERGNWPGHDTLYELRGADGRRLYLGTDPELVRTFGQQRAERGVPDAPFKKTPEWTELGLKKVIDEAVRGKYDRVTLPTGDQQARRYDLSKQVSEIRYDEKSGNLTALGPRGGIAHQGTYDVKALPDVIGKDAANRLMNSPYTGATDYEYGAATHRIAGDDLKVGGEGMRSYYDRIVPNTVKEYAKKLGVKLDLEPVNIGARADGLGEEDVNSLYHEQLGDGRRGRVPDHAYILGELANQLEQHGGSWQTAFQHMKEDFAEQGQNYHGGDFKPAAFDKAEKILTDAERKKFGDTPDSEEKNLSFKVTPELRAKVLGEGQRVGAADPKLIKTLGLAALGAGVGGLTGDTPGERVRNAIVGGVALGGVGALASREAKALSAGEKAELGARATMERPPAGAKEAADAITATFAPQTRGQMAGMTGQVVRAARGKIRREVAIAQQTLDRVSGDLNKQPIAKKLRFMDTIEQGAKQGDASRQPVATSIRRTLDDEAHAIQDMGTGKLQQLIADYFPHLWQDPDRAGQWLAKIMGKAPLEGSKSFLKQRTIPTILEGMFPEGVPKNLDTMTNAEVLAENKRQGGLVPVTFNPVEATMLKLREMKKYRMAQQVIGDLTERGLLKAIPEDGRMPVGYARIGDWAFSGKAAPEPVARVLNNYLSPGLRGNAAYDAYMAIGNTLNQAQLGFSAFHAGMTTIETMVSQNALALEHLVQGKGGQALREFATFPAAPFANYKRGEALRQAYLTAPGTLSGPMKAIADGAAEGGARYHMDVHNQAGAAFSNALEAKQYARAAKQFLPAMMEKVMSPVMNELVPRQKFGIFYDLAQSELAKLGPEAHPDEVTRAMQRAWDSVDNRMGQVVYDNLFWNKTAKDLFHASVRSVGWNWGTFNELGGGTKDLVGFVKDLATPGKAAELSHRAAYAMALPMTLGMLGAVTQYLYTGKGPDTLFDMFHPKTGTKDADGNDNRVVLPSYMKDVYGFGQHPVKTLTNKMNPLLSMTADALMNKDFYGDQIYDLPDFHTSFMQGLVSSAKAAGQLARYGAKGALPFAVENLVEDKKRAAATSEKALAFVGITPASREAVRSRAQNLMHDALARRAPQLTPEEANAAKVRADLRDKVRTQGAPAAMGELRARIKDGTLTMKQVQTMLADDNTPSLVKNFKRLSLPDAEAVYRASTSDREKKLWLPILQGKRARAGQ